jgi:hypothetical protein
MCGQCRKRRRKVSTPHLRPNFQCVYDTSMPSLPCEFCTSHNLSTPCIKLLGPKTEARHQQLVPSKPFPLVGDHGVPHEDISALQYLYSNDTRILCGSVKLDVLARLLARTYSPSIEPSGLRHMIIAHLMSKSGKRTRVNQPTIEEKNHVGIALHELSTKLSNNRGDIDESDILIAYLLAIWSCEINSSTAEVHITGVLQIMRHVSRKLGGDISSSPMAPLWGLLRDEILWLTRKSSTSLQLYYEFQSLLGPKTISQRQQYEAVLRGAMLSSGVGVSDKHVKVLFGRTMHTSIHTLVEVARILDRRRANPSTQDPLVDSVLVELHMEQSCLGEKGHEPLLATELEPLKRGEYVKDWQDEANVLMRCHDLIVLYACRLTIIALRAPSITEGLVSAEGRETCKALVSVLRRAREFVIAGIRGGRVFGTGILPVSHL